MSWKEGIETRREGHDRLFEVDDSFICRWSIRSEEGALANLGTPPARTQYAAHV